MSAVLEKTLEKVETHKADKATQAWQIFNALVSQLANGQEPDPVMLSDTLAKTGKSADELRAALKRELDRRDCRKLIGTRQSVQQRISKLTTKARDAEIDIEQHAAKVASEKIELETKLTDAHRQLGDARSDLAEIGHADLRLRELEQADAPPLTEAQKQATERRRAELAPLEIELADVRQHRSQLAAQISDAHGPALTAGLRMKRQSMADLKHHNVGGCNNMAIQQLDFDIRGLEDAIKRTNEQIEHLNGRENELLARIQRILDSK